VNGCEDSLSFSSGHRHILSKTGFKAQKPVFDTFSGRQVLAAPVIKITSKHNASTLDDKMDGGSKTTTRPASL
jgi:hypothetical protein